MQAEVEDPGPGGRRDLDSNLSNQLKRGNFEIASFKNQSNPLSRITFDNFVLLSGIFLFFMYASHREYISHKGTKPLSGNPRIRKVRLKFSFKMLFLCVFAPLCEI